MSKLKAKFEALQRTQRFHFISSYKPNLHDAHSKVTEIYIRTIDLPNSLSEQTLTWGGPWTAQRERIAAAGETARMFSVTSKAAKGSNIFNSYFIHLFLHQLAREAI
jgi:hypothetical protein